MNASSYHPLLEDAIRRVSERLDRARTQLGVDVLAFYVGNDPFWPSYLDCLAAPGAAFEEAVSQYRPAPFPEEALGFVADNVTDPLRHGDGEVAARLIQRAPIRNLLFGDFITREQIQSRAWFVQRDPADGQPEALLTANYRSWRDEQEWHRRDRGPLQELFDDLVAHLGEIETYLKGLYSFLVGDLIRAINVALPAEVGQRVTPESCVRTLEKLLTIATEALGFLRSDNPPDNWCGAIHLLDDSGQTLQAMAQTGRHRLPRHRHDVQAGEGVVSWVAVRGQAILIRDFETSPFESIRCDSQPGIRSQLGVPMIHDGRVTGVLSLQSPEPDAFSRTSVGFLTRIASLAAVVVARSDSEQVRAERDLYLEAIYASRRTEVAAQPLPSFEELVRTSTNPVRFDI